MDTDRLIQLSKHAGLGTEPPDLTDEERPRFEELKAETARLKAQGIMPDLPYEL